MKASARNQFKGTVSNIQQGAINDEVELTLADSTKILTMITHASSKALNLSNGKQAIGLVKASSVVLVDSTSDFLFSARNQLSGTVSAIKPGAVNTEVVIKIADEVHVVSMVTNESANELALAIGKPVTALFKSSSVILAVSARE